MKLTALLILLTICSIDAFQIINPYTDIPIPTVDNGCRPQCTPDNTRCDCDQQIKCVNHVCTCDVNVQCPLGREQCIEDCGCTARCDCDENDLNCVCLDDVQCSFERSRCATICGCILNCDCEDDSSCVCFDECKCPTPPDICPFHPDDCPTRCGCHERCLNTCFNNFCTCNPEITCPNLTTVDI